MTDELTKTFFDTFGIEKKQRKACVDENTLCPTPEKECEECSYYQYIHENPQISDRILLELICILSQHYSWEEENWFIGQTTIDELKEWLLEVFIEIDKIGLSKELKHQVRTLFEEG